MKIRFSKSVTVKALSYFIIGFLVFVLLTFISNTLTQYIQKTTITSKVVDLQDINDEVKTNNFIKNLKISKYERQGTDFFNPRYSPLRLGKPLDQIDRVYDYDFKQLNEVEKELKGINRKKVLRQIFAEVTQNTKTNIEKHLALLKFLQKVSIHNLQPVYSDDKQLVYDPLVLLELSEMRCGQVARVAVDIFLANGFKARVIQVAGHVLAEVYYDNKYHYFDADMFGGGETVIENGVIPSIVELSKKPFLIDSLNSAYIESELSYIGENNIKLLSKENTYSTYLSYNYFYKKAYGNTKPLYYQKTASEEQEKQSKWYGWNYYKTILYQKIQLGTSSAIYYIPSNVQFQKIKVVNELENYQKKSNNIILEWNESKDFDNDVLGYKIYISNQQRGWSSNEWRGKKSLEHYWNNIGGWQPEMYENLFKEPPHETALIKTTATKVSLTLPINNIYYITVMPYDAHGESVGKKVYPMSDEIKLIL